MKQLTGLKLGKEYKAVCCYPAYLTYMQSTSYELLGWMKLKRNQDCWENINKLKYTYAATAAAAK